MTNTDNITLVETYQITIFVAGDLAGARQVAREYCYNMGLCVTVTPTSFIYPGGEETGVMVGLLNYPRYPVGNDALWDQANALARLLVRNLNQRSCLLVAPNITKRLVIEPLGAKEPNEPW